MSKNINKLTDVERALWRAKRIEKTMTQAQLAEKIGVSDVAICEWETGVRHPTLKNRALVRMELGIALEYNSETVKTLRSQMTALALEKIGHEMLVSKTSEEIYDIMMRFYDVADREAVQNAIDEREDEYSPDDFTSAFNVFKNRDDSNE